MPVAGLLTTVEAAERIGCERSTISRWVQLGYMAVAGKIEGTTGPMFFEPAEVERVREWYAERDEAAL